MQVRIQDVQARRARGPVEVALREVGRGLVAGAGDEQLGHGDAVVMLQRIEPLEAVGAGDREDRGDVVAPGGDLDQAGAAHARAARVDAARPVGDGVVERRHPLAPAVLRGFALGIVLRVAAGLAVAAEVPDQHRVAALRESLDHRVPVATAAGELVPQQHPLLAAAAQLHLDLHAVARLPGEDRGVGPALTLPGAGGGVVSGVAAAGRPNQEQRRQQCQQQRRQQCRQEAARRTSTAGSRHRAPPRVAGRRVGRAPAGAVNSRTPALVTPGDSASRRAGTAGSIASGGFA